MLRIITIAILIAMALAAVGCGGKPSSFPSGSPVPSSPQPSSSPTISISPTAVAAGSADGALVITGSNFDGAGVIQSEVVWSANGSDTFLARTVDGNTHITAIAPATLLKDVGTAQIWVEKFDHVEQIVSAVSNSVTFTVTQPFVGSSGGSSAGFVSTGSMHTPRSGHTATLLANGKVLIAGGADDSVELFDPSSQTFATTGSMSTSRFGATATLLSNGRVLFAGGFGPGTSFLPRLDTAELYDPVTGTFNPTGSMHTPRVLHTATLLNDGRVLICGGTDEQGGGGRAVASAELYDPVSGTFAVTGGMGTTRAQHTATLLAGGEVLIVGGWNGHAADAADDPPWDPLFAELFESSSGSFKTSGSMGTTRNGHVAVRLATGKVLVLGGIPSLQNLHEQPTNPPYAELYDPQSHTFSSLGTVTVVEDRYTATLLNSGKVLLAGGSVLGQTVNSAELLDPESGSLMAAGGLITERTGHAATLLNDGRVLVTGGVDSDGNALATAELYK